MARKQRNSVRRFPGYSDLELRVLRDALNTYNGNMVKVVVDMRARKDPEGYAQVCELWSKGCELEEAIRVEISLRTAACVPPSPM